MNPVRRLAKLIGLSREGDGAAGTPAEGAAPGAPAQDKPAVPQTRSRPRRQVAKPPNGKRLTETRLVASAFGPAQLADDGWSRKIRIKAVPEEFLVGTVTPEWGPEGVIPFTEGDVIVGAYLFDAEKVEIEETRRKGLEDGEVTEVKEALLLPVRATLPYFFLPEWHKATIAQIIAHLGAAGRRLVLPVTEDLTAEVLGKLRGASLVWKEETTAFDLDKFISLVERANAQKGFEDILKVTLKGDFMFLLSVGRHIADVFDLSPEFMRIDAAKAVRLKYGGNDNTWLAPFGKHAASPM
jgi:hypothetical protein